MIIHQQFQSSMSQLEQLSIVESAWIVQLPRFCCFPKKPRASHFFFEKKTFIMPKAQQIFDKKIKRMKGKSIIVQH